MEILRPENNEFAHLKNNDLSASNASPRSSTIDEDEDDDRFSNVSTNDDKRSKSPIQSMKRDEIGSSDENQLSIDYSRQRLAKEYKDYEDRWLAHRNFLLYTQALNMKTEATSAAALFNPASFPTFPWPTGGNIPTTVDPSQQPRSPSSDDSGNQSNSGSTTEWTFEEQFRQLYELSDEPKRKEFLDDLFAFMQKRGTPVNRIPIMAKHVLDLYELFRLVVGKGGLVEVINKKLWREVTKGLNLPSSITSAAFTLRTQYMKYLYPYECEKLQLSSPSELQAAIEGNRREGRRPSYAFDYSSPPQIMAPPAPPPPPAPPSGPTGSSAMTSAFLTSPLATRSIDPTSGHDAMQQAAMAAAAAALSHHPFFLAAAAASSRDVNHPTIRIPSFEEHHHLQSSLSSPGNRSSTKRSLSPSFLSKSISEETNVNGSTKKLTTTTMINPNFNTRTSSFTPVTSTSPSSKVKLIAKENDQKSIQISIELNGVAYQGTLYACATPSTLNKD